MDQIVFSILSLLMMESSARRALLKNLATQICKHFQRDGYTKIRFKVGVPFTIVMSGISPTGDPVQVVFRAGVISPDHKATDDKILINVKHGSIIPNFLQEMHCMGPWKYSLDLTPYLCCWEVHNNTIHT